MDSKRLGFRDLKFFCRLGRDVAGKMSFVCFVSLFAVLSASLSVNIVLAQDPESGGTNLIKNPGFEGGWVLWGQQGGAVDAESCCGQHETPFSGRTSATSPYPGAPYWTTETWDGYIQPNGQFTQLFQYVPVVQNSHYRLSVWVFTNGMTGLIRRYSPSHGYSECGSTNSTSAVLIQCEFQAEETESQAMILQGNADAPMSKWVVSDDWELTKIVKPPTSPTFPFWGFRPVKYYLGNGSYTSRTDIIATRWNDGVGRQILLKTTNSGQANIRYTGDYEGAFEGMWMGFTVPPSSGVVEVQVNRSWMDAWADPPFRYGFEAREATIGHETGHALGLAHTTDNCNIMTQTNKVLAWRCSTSSPTWGDNKKIQNNYP